MIVFTWPEREVYELRFDLVGHIEKYHENPAFGSGKDEERRPVKLKEGTLEGTFIYETNWAHRGRVIWHRSHDRGSIPFFTVVEGI